MAIVIIKNLYSAFKYKWMKSECQYRAKLSTIFYKSFYGAIIITKKIDNFVL